MQFIFIFKFLKIFLLPAFLKHKHFYNKGMFLLESLIRIELIVFDDCSVKDEQVLEIHVG